MPLESTTTIAGLDRSWPLGGDPRSQGDDHLRLIKKVMKSVFPGSGGDGFSKAITATEDDLNATSGANSNFQDQINAITGFTPPEAFPSGTKMLFGQASAPYGWTQENGVDVDHMLRLVQDGGGLYGGVDSPLVMDRVPSHTHNASTSSSGNHTHSYTGDSSGMSYGAGANIGATDAQTNKQTITTDSDGAHTHTVTVNNNNGADNWYPKFFNMILAVKQ